MKKIFSKLLMLFVLSGFLMAAECDGNTSQSSDKQQAQKTEQALSEANRQIGMPAIKNFQERKLFKQILELRDQENIITYTYLVSEMNGTVGQFLGKSIGFGIPAATQFTNPVKTVDRWSSNGFIEQLPQADPNGLFMPTSTSATWVMLLDPEGVPRPVFVEPLIIVSPFKLH